MVDPLQLAAAVAPVLLQQAFRLVHAEVEFERHAEAIGRRQRAVLPGALDKTVRQTLLGKPAGRVVEIVLAPQLEPMARQTGCAALRSTTEWWLRSSTPRR